MKRTASGFIAMRTLPLWPVPSRRLILRLATKAEVAAAMRQQYTCTHTLLP